MSNDKIIEFCKNLETLLGYSIKEKTRYRYFNESYDYVEIYISIIGKNVDKIISNCDSFSENSDKVEWLNNSKVFNNLTYCKMEGYTTAVFIIDKKTIHWFKFDENLIGSIKSINKYNL